MPQPTKILIAGVDEVGRGPLAGPVVAAAVILNPKYPIEGLKDSKLLTELKRQELSKEIQDKAISYAIGEASVAEIEMFNIFHASLLAMQRAVNNLSIIPEHVLIDGTHCPVLIQSCEAIIRGDQTVPAISAASIVAKVYRDDYMTQLHQVFPEYNFARHKGYSTPEHISTLKKFGPSIHHRKNFCRVKESLTKSCTN